MMRPIILRELRDVILLFAAGLAMTAFWGYTDSARQFVIVGSFVGSVWIFLWKGNSYLGILLSTHFDWRKTPLKTFAVGMAATLAYTVGIVFLIVQFFSTYLGVDFGSSRNTIYSSVIITLIITLFMHGRSFLLSWREETISAEKLQREHMTAKYEALKSQVNPHFLFNSLNALTNLVHRDPDKAVTFIKQLSEVYRYVLDTRDREVVSLAEEMAFLRSYIYLQQIRFGQKLRIDIGVKPEEDRYVTPLALQMLIENAIKHNTISEEEPLDIAIHESDGYLVVQNSLQPKQTMREPSAGVGLDNIFRRYEVLSSKKVEVVDGGGRFTVRLPLLTNVGT